MLGGFGGFGGMPAVPQVPQSWRAPWNQLTSAERSAAQTLGWTEDTWARSIPPVSSGKDWLQLSRQEQDAARLFGFSENTWNLKEQGGKASAWATDSWQQANTAG